MSLAIVILAAGKGTRMKSKTPKVLHKLAGRELLGHVLAEASTLNPEKLVVVYSHDEVKSYVESNFPSATCVLQSEQLGTGHAAMMAKEPLADFKGDVMILMGDVPLMDAELMERFYESHRTQENITTFISVFMEDPTGLGRVVRDQEDNLQAIVEHKDATADQLKIDEINSGIYLAAKEPLFEMLSNLSSSNAQGEYYITDIVEMTIKNGQNAGTFTFEEPEALGGINSRMQLAYAEDYYQNRKREHFMMSGVTMVDPQSVYFSYDTEIDEDVELGPNVRFGTGVKLGRGTIVEGNLFVENAIAEQSVRINAFCHIKGAHFHENSEVGPFARLREGSVLEEKSVVGNFVEMKQSTIGSKSKCKHFSYIGNMKTGQKVNIGAGTITANYDGKNKYETVVEDRVFVGAGTTLVPPLTIEAGATTAANSFVNRDVPKSTLVMSKQNRVENADYVRPSKES